MLEITRLLRKNNNLLVLIPKELQSGSCVPEIKGASRLWVPKIVPDEAFIMQPFCLIHTIIQEVQTTVSSIRDSSTFSQHFCHFSHIEK